MNWRPVSRARFDAQVAETDRIRTQRDKARKDAAGHLAAARRMAEQNVGLSGLLETLTVTKGLDGDRAALERRIERLQRQLDQALGLDDPKVADGADWQSRREMKMRFDS